MTKIFNLRHNPLVSHISHQYDESLSEIVEYADSLHLFIPLTIDAYWINHEDCLLNFLRRLGVSVNGILTTSDQKILEVKKSDSHTYNHVIRNTPLLTSHPDFINKISIINQTLTPTERQDLNRRIRSVDLWKTFITRKSIKVSFIELMNMCDLSFSNVTYYRDQSLSFPGGRISVNDTSIWHTLTREIEEEVNIKLKRDPLSPTVLYHNIFDKLNDKFYHNILIFIPIHQSSTELTDSFRANYEVSSLQFIDMKHSRYKPIYNILLRRSSDI